MRAYVLRRTGAPRVLRLEEVPDPVPGPGEVVVRIEAIGINYAEVLSRKGLYGWAPKRPYIPGMEAVGVVESTGQRVLVGTQSGAYAERITLPSDRVLPAFDEFSVEENAAFAVNFMTAWVGLMEMARLRPTDRVAVTAAAGGVGTAAVQIANGAGCSVLALAGSDDKLERTRHLGADTTVNYRAPGWQERLVEVVRNAPPDVVLELVGGKVYQACLEALPPLGRLVVAGYASLDYRLWNPLSWYRAWRGIPRFDVAKSAERSIGVLATHIGYLLPDRGRLMRIWSELTEFTRSHGLRPVVGAVFPFEELPEAHRFMESRKSVGKIVVRVGDTAA
ncbi:MAG: zinc-binding alcohol dehydrogenase family protein [Gemmatimonadota bacterium]